MLLQTKKQIPLLYETAKFRAKYFVIKTRRLFHNYTQVQSTKVFAREAAEWMNSIRHFDLHVF